MGIMDLFKKLGKDFEPIDKEEMYEKYGTTDKYLISLRRQKQKLDEEEEKKRIKEELNIRYKERERKYLWGVSEGNNTDKVNITKSKKHCFLGKANLK